MEENFACFLESNAHRFGARNALIWNGGSLTWSELNQRASGFAKFLMEQGVRPGDRVALLLPNRWVFLVALFGILKLGATAAPLSPRLKTEELDVILADLKPKQVVTAVKVHGAAWVTPRFTESPAIIIYTSGSTGRPKGAVFSHRALAIANRSWGEVVMGLTENDMVLGVLPYSHNYGMYSGLLAPLLFGSTVALVERFTPEVVIDTIQRYHVTVFPGVATMFRRLLNFPLFAHADLSSLRLTVSGAAPCSWELMKEWQAKTGTRILRGYGMTEIPRCISYFVGDPMDFPDAVGRPVSGVEIRITDEAGRPVPYGEVGEMWIKSPTAMDGYLEAPQETEAVRVDGWFKTGDVASVSREGLIRIVGRKRERILRGGFSVFPQEVETVLISHPAVAEAAVVGIPSLDLGEEVVAFVTLKPMAETTPEALITHCREHLAHFKYPRRVTFLKEMPRGATGKILKSELLKGEFPTKASGSQSSPN
ncbi:MAG: class I adenylate-forming enzyme family protein [Candidatus Binatia bacterium]